MLGELPVRLIVLHLHVTSDVPPRLESVARRAPHGDPLPGLRDLAGRHVPEVREDVALVAESTHPGVLRHLPLAGKQATAVGTIMLQHKSTLSQKNCNNTLFVTFKLLNTSHTFSLLTIHISSMTLYITNIHSSMRRYNENINLTHTYLYHLCYLTRILNDMLRKYL